MTAFPMKALQKTFRERETRRRELATISSTIQQTSKRAIFSGQRSEIKKATEGLKELTPLLARARLICLKDPLLNDEGGWRAAQEEFVEAQLFLTWLATESVEVPSAFVHDPATVIGGLSDLIGELARLSVVRATEGDYKTVHAAYRTAIEVVEALLAMDLTGSLRSKFDQSKQHLRKIEDIRYDLSRRV